MNPRTDIFGWFDSSSATVPAHDPGVLGGICPVCDKGLTRPVMTISLMKDGDSRSFFFRCHRACYDATSEEEMNSIESSLIDSLQPA